MNKFMTEEYPMLEEVYMNYHATALVENSRQAVADFINAKDKDEIVFTKSPQKQLIW